MDISTLQKALLNPEIYPDHPEDIKWVETHISIVFLTGNYAYKIKKPVNFGFLDFTSLEKRKFFCEQEIILNRRLARDLYLDVIPIAEDRGKISIHGVGKIIEYAVKMRQIPEDLLMNRLLEKNRVTPGMMEAISEKLVQFYASAETSHYIESFAKPERVKQDTDENFVQTKRYIDITIPKDVYEYVLERTEQFFRERKDLFYRRIASHYIRDCHGDLRLEHIFWGKELSIIDCIEFNERFRYTDVAADIAFLAMDIDYHDRPELNEPLIRTYIQRSGDEGLLKVLDFYRCYRAYIRGKVDSFHLDDPNIPEERKRRVLNRARKYFDLAYQYARRF